MFRVQNISISSRLGSSSSLGTAVKVNLLNPGPYLFWFTVGGSCIVRGSTTESIVFVVTAIGALIASKIAVALLAADVLPSLGIRGYLARLVLRRWRPEDLDPYAELCADPDVMRWIGNGGVRTREECAKAISAFERAWDDRGFGLFAMELQASGRLVGFVGLSVPDFLPEILPSVEIGWRLAAGRIMEKVGMRLERETVDPSCRRPVRGWEISRLDWVNMGTMRP